MAQRRQQLLEVIVDHGNDQRTRTGPREVASTKDSDPDPADSNPHYDPNSNSDSDLDPRTHGACSEIAEGLVAHNVAVSSGQGVSIQFAVSIISDWTA